MYISKHTVLLYTRLHSFSPTMQFQSSCSDCNRLDSVDWEFLAAMVTM